MSHSVLLRLNDIVRAIDGATATLGSAATRHIPDDMKSAFPHIPWREIAGVGNILRHDYDRIDDQILGEIVTVHFGALRQAVVQMRAPFDDQTA